MPEEHLAYSKGNKERLERERKQEMDKMHGKNLNALDIFSGAGGSSQGLHESGVIGTTYAIESDTAACETFKKNFPDAIVYNYDANKFLERVMNINAGHVEGISYDTAGNVMSKMPAKGDIDMIVGGPPCQEWSRANRQNNPNKILKKPICPMREAIATLLSYVEFYRPEYFLLENVPGIKHHPLNGNDIPNYPSDGGPLKNGAMKFIFRVLTSLGYQCQHAILQAGAYGVPSSRTRVMIWACLPGNKLPKYPEPTNVFKSVPRNPPYLRRSAPHRPINIGDCISDLSLIEVENPHEEINHSTSKNKKKVGLGKQIYASTLRSEYQRRVQNSDSCQPLHNHVTGRISNERVRTVPLEAGADYRRMDEKLMTKAMGEVLEKMRKNKNYRNKKLEGRYGRLSVDELFKIFTTTRDKWTLHPYLPRLFTIRELARGMGFPDSFVWDMVITKLPDVLKQIGNAVPPPFARALGNELRKVLQELEYTSRESKDDEEMVDQDEISTNDQANQNMDIIEEIFAMSETDSDEEIDDITIAQLERQFNQSTDNQTDAGSEDDDEKNADADDEVTDESDVDIDGDMEDREDENDLESEDDNENNWSTDEEMLNDSEVDADEDIEGQVGQVGQDILKFEEEIERNLDTDERMSEGSDIDADEDMKDRDDLESSADEDDINRIIGSEEKYGANTRMQMEEGIGTGGSRNDAIVIDDSE
ncbi:hypothetical protein BOTCAL_0088g00340 [Botryotinia calthae]|uniref:Cytosine-specific methyltransferase n=1 Tax=Botryotinia calthae TaxID=38488 RepID=A0A4Y8D9P5_9HELO|nr:hypothetical protein BOTCAL_0088g00340 [Botryotinia calthae]